MHSHFRAFPCLLLGTVILLPSQPPARAQHDILSTDSYVTTHWGTKEGLPSNEARPILQTRDGYIWIGTGFGLARFDGMQFEIFNTKNTLEIEASDVTALHEDPAGNLWVGYQNGGVLKYAARRFQTLTSCAKLAFTSISDIFSDSTGGLYVCSSEGLFLIRGDSGSFVPLLPEIALRGFTAADNTLYVYNYSIVRLSSTSAPQIIATLPDRGRINRLLVESPTSFLAAGLDYLQRFRLTPKGSLSPAERYKLELSSSFLPDADGQYLVGTFGKGVLRFDRGRITTPQGLSVMRGPGRQIHNLFRDSEGGVWATTSGGVFRFSRSFFKTFGEAAGLANEYTWNLRLTRDGTLWVGTGRGGTYKIGDGTSRLLLMKDGMPDNHVTEMFESSDGRMWFGGDNGRLITMLHGVTKRVDQLPGYRGGWVLSIAEDFTKRIWVGTREGLHTIVSTIGLHLTLLNMPGH
jgi:ligand-binding sensor domain-containing protein